MTNAVIYVKATGEIKRVIVCTGADQAAAQCIYPGEDWVECGEGVLDTTHIVRDYGVPAPPVVELKVSA